MRKSEMIKAVQETLVAQKANKKLIEAINEIMAEYNVTKGKTEAHPPVLNNEGEIIELWCTRHEQYEPVDAFATTTRNQLGYMTTCKIAGYQWHEYSRQIKALETKQAEAMDADNFEEAKTIFNEVKALKATRANPYPYPTDEEIEALLPKTNEDKQ